MGDAQVPCGWPVPASCRCGLADGQGLGRWGCGQVCRPAPHSCEGGRVRVSVAERLGYTTSLPPIHWNVLQESDPPEMPKGRAGPEAGRGWRRPAQVGPGAPDHCDFIIFTLL